MPPWLVSPSHSISRKFSNGHYSPALCICQYGDCQNIGLSAEQGDPTVHPAPRRARLVVVNIFDSSHDAEEPPPRKDDWKQCVIRELTLLARAVRIVRCLEYPGGWAMVFN